jgi:cell division protein FtsI (penicillin-binding protein 3)
MQTRLFNIEIEPAQTVKNDMSVMAEELSIPLEMDADEIRARIAGARGYITLKKRVSLEAKEMIDHAKEGGNLRGVFATPVPARVYPELNLASQIIGFVGEDYQGLEGIENAFNNELSGKDSGGRGSRVVLTINANVQYILEKVAQSTLEETNAESVVFMAMDPRSGEILGSAVLPGFDPNNHRAYPVETFRNVPALEPYEPGSVLKIFTVAALMDSGAISENSRFVCNGVYERVFPRETVIIRCADGHAHGSVGPREIIINSCNVGVAYASDMQRNQEFYQSMLDFGLGKRTGAWKNKETAGLLKEPEMWSGRTRQSIAMGQEIAVSALQIMQAASVIANDGVLVPPKIVSRIVSADGKTTWYWDSSNNQSRQVIKPETARKMRSYMADTATSIGTAWRANIEDLHLAAKTGTAQYRDPLTGKYSTTDFIASCIAMLPTENPSLVLYAAIVKPRGETYGGRIAAPAIREVAELLIDYLGIPRGRNVQIDHPGSIPLSNETLPVIGATVPRFYDLSKKTLLPLLDRRDIRVEIRGDGWVKRQAPPPGTPVTPNTVIILELE